MKTSQKRTRLIGVALGLDRGLFLLYLIAIFALPIAWGSNREMAVAAYAAVIGCIAAASTLLYTCHPSAYRRPDVLWIPIILWLIWLFWISLQIISLPAELLQRLSPRSFEMHQHLLLFGITPQNTLSISPAHTRAALMVSGALFLTYLATQLLAGSQKRSRIVLMVLLLAAVAQASFFVFESTAGGSALSLMKKIKSVMGETTGTFVNRNHFATYMLIGLSSGIALILSGARAPAMHSKMKAFIRDVLDFLLSGKLVIRAALVLMVVALVMTASRMGNLAFVGALFIAGFLWMLARDRAYLGRAVIFFLSIVLIDVLIVSQSFGLKRVADRIEATTFEEETRSVVYADLEPVVEAYQWTGSGLGTFAYAYSPYRSPEVHKHFDHAHNDYLQFLIEVGLIGGLILATLIAVHLIHAIRVITKRRSSQSAAVSFACLMALSGVGIQSVAEFCLQIPAISVSLVALMALSQSRSLSGRRKSTAIPGDSDSMDSASQR